MSHPAPGLRIVYAGTPDFAATALHALIEAGFPPVAVYTQPDRPAGRGHKLQPSPVKRVALEAGLPVEQPLNFRTADAIDTLAGYQPDLMIVAAYGLILPRAVLDIPRLGCINIHASLLPRWRGAAPIQRAIEAGDTQTGITLMQMDEGLDTGDMLVREAIDIQPTDTGGTLHDKLATLGAQMIVPLVQRLASGEMLTGTEQNDEDATYAKKIGKADARLDWSCPADRLERIVRAYHPWPVAWSPLGDQVVKIHAAHVMTEDAEALPGTVLEKSPEGIRVACGEGQLIVTRLQLPGGKPLSVRDFINGGKPLLEPGTRLG
ncbi:MAG: methionyl-tRNA formyltransferase [Gammaproteobacteria bacterium]|nr:MAG: methionyl-tRNA formyltransferase [Gammaproteobacteria bacterium]